MTVNSLPLLRIFLLPLFSIVFIGRSSITVGEMRRLDAVGEKLAAAAKGESRSDLIERLGQPQLIAKRSDIWEDVPDENNGERLVVFYDEGETAEVHDGAYSSWRGDDQGNVRGKKESDYYLHRSSTSGKEWPPLKRRYRSFACSLLLFESAGHLTIEFNKPE